MDLKYVVLENIKAERNRQEEKWGIERHDNGKWLSILVEEVGEVAQAMQKDFGWGKPTDAQHLFRELIQVSAVSAAWAEQIAEQEYLNKKPPYADLDDE